MYTVCETIPYRKEKDQRMLDAWVLLAGWIDWFCIICMYSDGRHMLHIASEILVWQCENNYGEMLEVAYASKHSAKWLVAPNWKRGDWSTVRRVCVGMFLLRISSSYSVPFGWVRATNSVRKQYKHQHVLNFQLELEPRLRDSESHVLTNYTTGTAPLTRSTILRYLTLIGPGIIASQKLGSAVGQENFPTLIWGWCRIIAR